jgi:DNA-binding transcriptional MocR family regulator
MPGGELHLTHQLMASALGVKREGVTEAAGRLRRRGAISYRRGHIKVLDRPVLESAACECYKPDNRRPNSSRTHEHQDRAPPSFNRLREPIAAAGVVY